MSSPEHERYASYLALPGFGPSAVVTLGRARVQVLGAGAIGGPALACLARAGVGTIGLDDAGEVAPADGAHLLYARETVGEPRAFAAAEALRAINNAVQARPSFTGARFNAVLICPESPQMAREAAESARALRLPHIVAQGNGDGGHVATIPVGAPCYACVAPHSTPSPPTPGASIALGGLAAAEVLLLLAAYAREPRARLIGLDRGHPYVRVPERRAGCACERPPKA
jgi:molybdopterin/thiamine biosynthesis adenylyltransferase